MNKRRFLALLVGVLLAACTSVQLPPVPTARPGAAPTVVASSAPNASPFYMPRNIRQAFDQGSRSLDGKPGPNYTQNRSVHDIAVTIAPPGRTVSVTQQITYTNNARDYINLLTVRLYLNVRLPNAERENAVPPDFLNSGIQIDEFSVDGVVQPWSPQPGSGLTYALIKLPLPLAPGDSIKFGFKSHYELSLVPKNEGVIDPTTFFVAYFFPRISPNNDTDQYGMDISEFTYRSGRERFNEFADFTYAVTVPKNFAVWGTGDLQNPDEVLQPTYAQRLKDSKTSDEVINIAQPDEVKAGKVTAQSDTVTWKWKADNVTDVAFGLSDHYVWDAGSVVVDPATKRRASVQTAYPIESTEWKAMVEDSKAALIFGSTQWPGVPYPYSSASAFMAGADEEFPMIINDGDKSGEPAPGVLATVRFIAAHEYLHTWFPFYMGIDERRYPMLDEGWTTAFEYLFNLQDTDQAKADALFKAMRSSRLVPTTPDGEIPIITPADSLRGAVAGSYNAYEKPALAYLALKELMGDAAFKASLHEFISRWNGKYPLPWDLFNTFNDTYKDASGDDLTWFFQNWFFDPHFIDLAVASVEKVDGGTQVQVDNVGGFAVPFDLIAIYADDSSETFRQNPALWKASPRSATLMITSTKEVKTVVLDDGIFMDATRLNNIWPPPPSPDPNAVVIGQAASADGTATLTMTLPPKTVNVGGAEYHLPSGIIIVPGVLSPTITPEDAIKSSAEKAGLKIEDSQIVDGGMIAGYPSKTLRAKVNLGSAAFGYDLYAFSTKAGTYSVLLLTPDAPTMDSLRNLAYPKLLETMSVDPK